MTKVEDAVRSTNSANENFLDGHEYPAIRTCYRGRPKLHQVLGHQIDFDAPDQFDDANDRTHGHV